MDIRDLVYYNHRVRRLYLDALRKLPWAEVVKNRGSSFDSMRNIFLHLTLVEDRWINYIIPSRFKDWVDPDFDRFRSVGNLEKYMCRVEKQTLLYLDKASPEELCREVTVPWGDTPNVKVRVETVLAHMVAEDLIHIGELSDILWRLDVEPPYLAFWRFKHQLDSQKHPSSTSG